MDDDDDDAADDDAAAERTMDDAPATAALPAAVAAMVGCARSSLVRRLNKKLRTVHQSRSVGRSEVLRPRRGGCIGAAATRRLSHSATLPAMSAPGDGELEGAHLRAAPAPASAYPRQHGHRHHARYRPPSYALHTRLHGSLRPTLEVVPLMAAVAAGAIFAGVIICHDLAHNHEIFVSKRRRIAQVVDSEDAVAYARETNLARAGYDHALRRWALRRAPRVFGGGRRGEEYGPDFIARDKWRERADGATAG